MPRQKKSRKVGKIGVVKSSSNKRKPTEKRVKKPLGKPAGSRNSEALTTAKTDTQKVNKDPRHGSKKPVDLIKADTVDKKTNKAPKQYFSPKQELAAIEKDQRLAQLLDMLDIGKTVSRDEQKYVEQKLARHKELCDLLGISDDPEESSESKAQSDDLFSELDALDINDFKD
ncbi:Der GTPase-activating protein YihI [Paraglaciecola aestuariivivens]